MEEKKRQIRAFALTGLFIFSLCLFGCSAPGHARWNHSDATMQSAIDRESYDCEYKAKVYAGKDSVAKWGIIAESVTAKKEYERCMQSKGYSLAK